MHGAFTRQEIREAAREIGCDEAAVAAVIEVETGGERVARNLPLVRRFEPHHVPQKYWDRIGFHPRGHKPWKASLRLSANERRTMLATMITANKELAYKATSWGSFQIMGFNHELAGFSSAVAMVDHFFENKVYELRAFTKFCISTGVAKYLASHDWLSFAASYNGSGQTDVYAAKIESAYRRHAGTPSAPLLRVGMKSKSVKQLQQVLNALDYDYVEEDGVFGNETLKRVKEFQFDSGIAQDGIVGGLTYAALRSKGGMSITNEGSVGKIPIEQRKIDRVIKTAIPSVTTAGALSGISMLTENAQTIVAAGTVVGVLGVLALYLLKNKTT